MGRTLSLLLAASFFLPTLAATLPASAAAAYSPASDSPNLNGVWEDEKFTQFRIHQDDGANTISSTLVNDTCKGGPRSSIVEATFNGRGLNGSLTRCVGPDDLLVKNCNLSEIWQTPFTANFTDGQIVGNVTVEWWVWNTTANGTWVNCTLDHLYDEGFSWDRLDCAPKTFGELAERYISDPAKRDDAIKLAKDFENAQGGKKLVWTAAQAAPGGLEPKMEAFVRLMAKWGYTGTINSAYRALLYQAHFADLYLCALQIHDTLKSRPELIGAFRDSVAAIDAEIDGHVISAYSWANVTGLPIRLIFTCYRAPLEGCPHVNERAADITFVPNNTKLDWIASLYGMCRPYLFRKSPDIPHWEFFGPNPFSNSDKCFINSFAGDISLSISGNSPINLLLTTPDGRRIGYDAVNHTEVNDFGDAAMYSGAGTEPQQILVQAGDAAIGDYSVTGVGTGAGPYTVSSAVIGGDGIELDGATVTGTAAAGAAIAPLHFAIPHTYAAPNPFTAATKVSSSGTSASYSVPRGGASATVTASGGTFTGLAYDSESGVIAIGDDGAGGSTQVTIPAGLLDGPYLVRVDGTAVAATRTNASGGATLSFDRPAGGSFITIEGTPIAAGPAPSGGGPSASGDSTLLYVVAVAIAAAAAVGFVLWRRAQTGKQP
jgi:hypothetical protein